MDTRRSPAVDPWRGLLFTTEVVITSIAGQAIFAVSWNNAFRSYWSELGPLAADVVRPKGGAADVFALLLLFGLLIVVPVLSLVAATDREARAKLGRPWPAHLAGGALVYVLVVAGTLTPASWVAFVLAGVVALLLANDLWRLVDTRARRILAVAVIVVIVAAPRVVAGLSAPHISRGGVGGLSGILFPADLPGLVHVQDGTVEKPVAVLGRTIFDTLVVVELCAADQRAFEVPTSRLVRPARPAGCP